MDEEDALRAAALQNVQSILQARQRADRELLAAKERLEEETRVLELLQATGAILASNLDPQRLVQAATDAATELSGAQFGAFFFNVTDEHGEAFSLYTLSGARREDFDTFGHPRATALFGPTFRGEGVLRIGDLLADPRYGLTPPHHGIPPGHLPVRSYLAVPVRARSGEVIGGLFFGHADCDVFTDRAERLVVGVAAHAAIAMDNARLYDRARLDAEERALLLAQERAARHEVERISLMKDEFLATLSHELRTPLNAILGWSDFLLSGVTADSELRRGLETVVRNARAQAQLIDDLLDMNAIVSGKIRLDVQPTDLASIIDAAIDSVQPSADSKSVRIRRLIDPKAGPVVGDPNRLQQVVWNLLTNAVKFTPKGGKIDVLLQRVNSHVEIVVHDSGIGITAEFLPLVFERFRQADSSTKRKYGGLGLGLSIVKQLVELHGGSVAVSSDGPDQGATFTVALPLRAVQQPRDGREHPTAVLPTASRGPQVSLAGTTVLVVDDEPDARDLVKAVLVNAAAQVITASSAREGLDRLVSDRPDIIVSDIGMPERDGYQLMQDIRALPSREGGRTLAIALTAFARTEDRTRAMLAGYQAHVSKPIEPRELIATIKSLVVNSGRDADG